MYSSPGASSPGTDTFPRLERILELVTEHERVYREQDIRLADLLQKVAELERSATAEWAPLLPLKERNVAMELDLARAAMETVVRQMASISKTNQALQVELRSCQQKQAQQQLTYESTIAVLQADMAALRSRLDDVQSNTQASFDQLRSSTRVQVEQQRADAEEQLQSAQRELESKLSRAVSEASSQASASVRELEGWTKHEMLQLTANLKAVVQSCSNHQAQINLQMEALQQQWDHTSEAMEALQQEDKRCKKHINRLQQQAEDLQRASQASSGTAAALQQLQETLQGVSAQQQQLQVQHEVLGSSTSSAHKKLQEVVQQLQQLDVRCASQAVDVTSLAESVVGCLAAARAHAATAAASAQPPNSYLSNLLGPAVPPVVTTKQLPWGAWDEQLARVDGVAARLRRQQRANELGGGSIQGSPPRHSTFTPRSAYSSAAASPGAGGGGGLLLAR